MTRLNVPDMSCGHCKASIEKAITALDPAAQVGVDLTAKTVDVSTTVPDADIIAAVRAKGFDASIAI